MRASPSPIEPPWVSKLVLVLNSYFDESGKQATHKMVAFSGFLSESWDGFNSAWNHQLRKYKLNGGLHLGADSLKASEGKLEMYADFINVIRMHIEKGFSVTADTGGFADAEREVKDWLHGDVHYIAVEHTLLSLRDYARATPNATVNIICDDDPAKACGMYKSYARFLQAHPNDRELFRSIAFADDRFYPQLQAADLFSWVSRAESEYRFHAKDYSLRKLFTEFERAEPDDILEIDSRVWTAEYLKKLKPMKKSLRAYNAQRKP